MIDLNDVLAKTSLDLASTLLMRHRPQERGLKEALPWLAADQPDVYNAYQSHHSPAGEKALCKASHLISFIGHEPGKALFVGVFKVAGWREITVKRFVTSPHSKRLVELGVRIPKRDRFLWFQLERQEELQAWQGKLVVGWSGERGWRRWASRNTMPIHAIHDESVLVERMPAWNQIVLDWAQLEALPVSWQHRISQWRGIYVIVDRKSGKSYVGAAYGKDNLLGRWRSYASTGSGGNVELRGRDPRHFQFAILERVSPDAPTDEVIRLESCWKDRLGTREFGLNKN